MRTRRGRSTSRRGQALAEFAIIMPVLFLVIAGIIEFGRGWNIKQAVTDAAREGARYFVVQDNGLAYTDVDAKIKARLALASISTADPPTTITMPAIDYFHCQDATKKGGAEITVLIVTKYRMGWVGALMGWAGGSSTINISSKSTMRNEC